MSTDLGFETWSNTLIETSGGDAQVFVATEGVEPLLVDGEIDPHAWNALTNGMIYVRNIAAGMAKADAANAATYRANADAYVEQLGKVHDNAVSEFSALPDERRTVVTAHDAFGYLEQAYGLTFLAPVGIDTDAEPSASDLAALIDHLNEIGAGALFVENITSPALVEQISRETGLEIGGALVLGCFVRERRTRDQLRRDVRTQSEGVDHCPAVGQLMFRMPGSRLPRIGVTPVAPGVASELEPQTVGLARTGSRRAEGRRNADIPPSDIAPQRLVLDLRANAGGDFDRMRRVASLFAGPRPGAIRLHGREGVTEVPLPVPLRAVEIGALDVLIGPETASSAEVLAALLRRHAGARLVGARTLGKDWLSRLVPPDHDWRLSIRGRAHRSTGRAAGAGSRARYPGRAARRAVTGVPSSACLIRGPRARRIVNGLGGKVSPLVH